MTQARVPLRRVTTTLLRAAAWGGELSFLRLWQRWEPIEMRLWRVRTLEPDSVLQFGVSPYRGPTTDLADATHVPHGARILHLHLANGRVAETVRSANGNAWALAPRLSRDLDALSDAVASGALGPVVAIRGITVHAWMARRFGFEVRPLPRNLRYALIHALGGLVIASYRPEDSRALEEGIPWPGEIWMSAAMLQRRRSAMRTTFADRDPVRADP